MANEDGVQLGVIKGILFLKHFYSSHHSEHPRMRVVRIKPGGAAAKPQTPGTSVIQLEPTTWATDVTGAYNLYVVRSASMSYVNLIYHIVFSTKDREPLITPAYESKIHQYIGGMIDKRGGIALAINGMEDHLHVLAKLRQDKSLSDVIRDLKAGASGWMHNVFPSLEDFAWQKGYGAFTVSQSQVNNVRDYIAKQKIRHQERSFKDEFVAMLEANEIEFDMKYLFS